ncbi:WXG100-like domain-containing protein [Glycomyces rhizosphaerae]|uniref:Outer membrane channel protein CpnT-like N-terminal domain-containing protein n=1 Tax=Glycomyces rhizosphaerae TaxID=2054422 RepID=A0ABV7Q1D2_9ACTN
MGMQLPSELTSLLSMLGYDWPEPDETKLFDLGNTWTDLADRITGAIDQLEDAAHTVIDSNISKDIDAFRSEWEDGESAVRNIADIGEPSNIISIGLMIAAGVVLALKLQMIVQLVTLAIQIAQAIATAVVTFGASLLEIPIFKMITSMLIDQLLNMAIEEVLNG